MFGKNKSLKTKLLVLGSSVTVIAFGSLAFTAYSVNKTVRHELDIQKDLITKGVRAQLAQMRDSAPVYTAIVRAAVDQLEQAVVAKGKVTVHPQKNIQVTEAESVPSLEVNGEELTKNFQVTDKIKEEFGSTATIFVKKGDDFVRVSTNVILDDGKRALGTKLSTSGLAYKALMQGKDYFGVTQIINKPYFTGYKPIFSEKGQVIGAWYAGYVLNSLLSAIDSVEHAQILEKGFFVLYKREDDSVKAVTKNESPQLQSETYLSWLRSRETQDLSLEKWKYSKTEESDGHIIVSATYQPDVIEKVASITISATGLLSGVILLILLTSIIFAKRLERTLSFVTADAESVGSIVAATASQLTSTGQQLSEGSARAAASVEESVASLEELVSMVGRNAQSAKDANNLTSDASSLAAEGSGQIRLLMSAMTEIQESSKKMSEIISVIEDIAFQTNLLSLNASVEAARAGEHGKGFAVVADAVRTLAQKSAESAGNITKIINGITQKIADGTSIAQKNAKSFGEVTEVIQKLNVIVGEIATASEEQNSGLKQISTAMTQFDQTTQDNALAAQESSQVSQELSKNAEELSRVVDELKVLIKGSVNEAARHAA